MAAAPGSPTSSRSRTARPAETGGAIYGDKVQLATGREVDERIYPRTPCGRRKIRSHRRIRVGAPRDPTHTVTWSHAYYVQAAYRLPQFKRLWKPYFRFEHIGIDDADVMFATVPRLDGATLGVRYDISQYAAVKGEYRTWTRGEDTARNHGGFLQVCFTF